MLWLLVWEHEFKLCVFVVMHQWWMLQELTGAQALPCSPAACHTLWGSRGWQGPWGLKKPPGRLVRDWRGMITKVLHTHTGGKKGCQSKKLDSFHLMLSLYTLSHFPHTQKFQNTQKNTLSTRLYWSRPQTSKVRSIFPFKTSLLLACNYQRSSQHG